MADQILEQAREIVEGQVDFEGQKLAEVLSTVSLSLVAAVAFIVGYVLQDIKLAFFITLGGTALTFLLVVPAWPFFNKHPLRWLPVRGGAQVTVPRNIVIDEKVLG